MVDIITNPGSTFIAKVAQDNPDRVSAVFSTHHDVITPIMLTTMRNHLVVFFGSVFWFPLMGLNKQPEKNMLAQSPEDDFLCLLHIWVIWMISKTGACS